MTLLLIRHAVAVPHDDWSNDRTRPLTSEGIEEFREGRTPLYIRAVIYVERDSQKRIIIGSKGSRIREVGQAARKKIEAFTGQSVYLDLWVKVLPNWRRSTSALERFGYHIAKEHRT